MSIRPLDLRASGNNVRRRSDFVDRTVGAVWRAFDFQMLVYAALLACFGLAMAYSNTVAGGVGLFDGGFTLLRGLMWLPPVAGVLLPSALYARASGDARLPRRGRVRLPLAQDLRVAAVLLPARVARPDARDRQR